MNKWSIDITSYALPGQGQRGTELWRVVRQSTGPTLAQNEIHLWCAHLDKFIPSAPELYRVLSHGERTRAQSFQFHKDRDSFVIQTGLLRHLLSGYLPVSPAEFEFVRGPFGKPELVAAPGEARLHFNMSHSRAMALYAFTCATPVGVDIERIGPMADLENIARIFFTPRETTALSALPDTSRLETFFNCWTRKEAVLKATGQGIREGVDGVEVNVATDEPARVLSIKGDASAARGWSLHSLHPVAGYTAALAYQRPELELVCCVIHPGMPAKRLSSTRKFSSDWVSSGSAEASDYHGAHWNATAGRRPANGT